MITKSFKNWLPSVLSLLLSSLLFVGCMTPEGKKTLEALRQLAAEIPVYPEFVQIDSTSASRPHRATLSFFYQAPTVSFSEVESFYIKEMTARGWRIVEEAPYSADTEGVQFRKGEYLIDVSHSSPRRQNWDYDH